MPIIEYFLICLLPCKGNFSFKNKIFLLKNKNKNLIQVIAPQLIILINAYCMPIGVI